MNVYVYDFIDQMREEIKAVESKHYSATEALEVIESVLLDLETHLDYERNK